MVPLRSHFRGSLLDELEFESGEDESAELEVVACGCYRRTMLDFEKKVSSVKLLNIVSWFVGLACWLDPGFLARRGCERWFPV